MFEHVHISFPRRNSLDKRILVPMHAAAGRHKDPGSSAGGTEESADRL